MSKEYKQWIIVRKDLGMRKGKMIAQGAHASVGVVTDMMVNKLETLATWKAQGCTKIAVSVDTEEELLALELAARTQGLPCYLVRDAGKTEFNGEPTYTALAIGPCTITRAKNLVGSLKLL